MNERYPDDFVIISKNKLMKKIMKLPTMRIGKTDNNKWYRNLKMELEEMDL